MTRQTSLIVQTILYILFYGADLLSSTYTTCVQNQASNKNATYKWWCWQYFPNVALWQDAMAACIADGGTLANVYSRDQWVALQTYLDSFNSNLVFPWISLYSADENTPLTWMKGVNFSTDTTSVTVNDQNMLDYDPVTGNGTFSISGSCQSFADYCHSGCCYYMQKDSSKNLYQFIGWGCSPGVKPNCNDSSLFTKPYVCEYESPVRISGFLKNTQNGYLNVTVLNVSFAEDMKYCAVTCMNTKFCVSIDFNSINGTCRLLISTFDAKPAAFVFDPNYNHYDFLGNR